MDQTGAVWVDTVDYKREAIENSIPIEMASSRNKDFKNIAQRRKAIMKLDTHFFLAPPPFI